jgi:methionyl-tRNA formyltransferase
MKIIFFGSGSYVIPILEFLKKDFEVYVFTTEKNEDEPVIRYSIKNNLSYVPVLSFDEDLKSSIVNLKSSIAVVAKFGLIIPKDILDSFKYGVLNIHPSLLPKYRGAAPVQTAILNGDKITGVSVMKLDEKMDHGPILVQKEEEIGDNETADELYLRLFKIGADLLSQNLNQYIKGGLKLVPQDDKKAIYVEPLTRQNGYVNLNKPPEPDILKRMIRAYFPWPGAWTETKIMNKKSRIKLLPENKIQVEGKKPISLKDFENGYPQIYNKIVKLFQ